MEIKNRWNHQLVYQYLHSKPQKNIVFVPRTWCTNRLRKGWVKSPFQRGQKKKKNSPKNPGGLFGWKKCLFFFKTDFEGPNKNSYSYINGILELLCKLIKVRWNNLIATLGFGSKNDTPWKRNGWKLRVSFHPWFQGESSEPNHHHFEVLCYLLGCIFWKDFKVGLKKSVI